MANLALCARTAHQGGSLVIAENSGTRICPWMDSIRTMQEQLSRASEVGRPFLGTLLGCSKRVPRLRCENRNASVTKVASTLEPEHTATAWAQKRAHPTTCDCVREMVSTKEYSAKNQTSANCQTSNAGSS